jgi:formylglycine-generating enzyme required for sulfatase activity
LTAIYTFTDADETVDIVVDEDEMIDTVTDVDETVDEDAETPDSDVLITFGEMSLITAGTFEMGSPSGELGRDVDEMQHTVILTINFYINTYEVTQGEFSSAMGYNPSNFSSCGDNCPVEQVNWHEALVYANKRSKQEGLDECFDCTGVSPDFECSLKTKFIKPQDCNGYRLPTESEWEYAARGNTTTAFYNGDITHTFGNDWMV